MRRGREGVCTWFSVEVGACGFVAMIGLCLFVCFLFVCYGDKLWVPPPLPSTPHILLYALLHAPLNSPEKSAPINRSPPTHLLSALLGPVTICSAISTSGIRSCMMLNN